MRSPAHTRTHKHYTHAPQAYTHLTKQTVDAKQSAISHKVSTSITWIASVCQSNPQLCSLLPPPHPRILRVQEGLLFSQNPLPSRHPFQMSYTRVQATEHMVHPFYMSSFFFFFCLLCFQLGKVVSFQTAEQFTLPLCSGHNLLQVQV